MTPYPALAHIHSLNGEMREITVLEQKDNVNYIVEYGGVKCTAILIGITVNSTQMTNMEL